MTSPFIWGNAPRTTNDNTLIDEAIAEAIGSHEADPEAHLGADESLQSHRASEIIDHRAESVVNDKIARKARRYVAIVDPLSDSDFDTVAGAAEYAASIGGGDIFITAGRHLLTEDLNLPATCALYGNGDGESYILSSDNTDRYVIIQEKEAEYYWYSESCNFTTASPNFSYDDTGGDLTPGAIGLPVFSDDDYQAQGILASYNSTTNVATMEANAKRTFSGISTSVKPGAEFTNGSNGIRIISSESYFKTNFYIGATIMTSHNSVRYQIIAIADNQTAIVDRNYSGTTGIYDVRAIDTSRRTINLEGIQFGDDTADVSLKSANASGSVIIQDCSFWVRNNKMEVLRTTYMENVQINSGSGASANYFSNLYMRNCTLYARESATRAMKAATTLSMDNVDMIIASGSFAGIFEGTATYYDIQNCSLSVSTSQTLTNASGANAGIGGNFLNNYVGFSGSAVLTFAGQRWQICNNRFARATTGGVVLATGGGRNVFCNNIMNGAPTNNGTNSIIANNMTTY